MTIRCPHCGSTHIRESYGLSAGERIARVFGFLQLRCRDCDARFRHALWDVRNAVYARCPRCYRLDLSLWDTHHYRAPASWRFLLKIGAKPRRCEACRCNFVSFRPAKMNYVRLRQTAATRG